MPPRRVPPESIRTLKEWAAVYGAENVRFDPETREATIYKADGTTKVSSIPWKREGDIVVVLQNPSAFTAAYTDTATKRAQNIRDGRAAARLPIEEQLRAQEAALLESWRRLAAAPESERGTLRRQVLLNERELRDTEAQLANPERHIQEVGRYYRSVAPVFPLDDRGITAGDTT